MSKQQRKPMSSAMRYGLWHAFWALMALSYLYSNLILMSVFDMQVFESMGMVKSPVIRDAFYDQVLELNAETQWPLIFGVIALWLTSYLFARSQLNYFRNAARFLNEFAQSGNISNEKISGKNLGVFSPHIEQFDQMHLEKNAGFLREQGLLSFYFAWGVLFILILASSFAAFKQSRKLSLSSYSCLRDLRRFMEGNHRQRLLLRSGDLGKEYIHQMNKALDKLGHQLEEES